MAWTLREDLTFDREVESGVAYYRVDDPKEQRSFRIYEVEYLAAQALSGAQALAPVVARLNQDHKLDIDLAGLRQLAAQLETSHILTGEAPDKGDPGMTDRQRPTDADDQTLIMPKAEAPAPGLPAGTSATGQFDHLRDQVSDTHATLQVLAERKKRQRRKLVLTMLTALLMLMAASGGVAFFFTRPKAVRVVIPELAQAAVLYPLPGVKTTPGREEWLAFGAAGDVASLAAGGALVAAGDVVAELKLPPKQEKKLAATKKALAKVTSQRDKAKQALDQIEHARAALEEKKKALADKPPAEAKKDLAAINRELTALAKKARKPKDTLTKLGKQLVAAEKQLTTIETSVKGYFVRAPFAGTVTDARIKAGAKIKKGQQAILLRDTGVVNVRFPLPEDATLQPGGEVQITYRDGAPQTAKVVAVTGIGEEKGADVQISNAAQLSVDNPRDFRLVRRFEEQALRIPATAVLVDERGSRVLILREGAIGSLPVTILKKDGKDIIAQPEAELRKTGFISGTKDAPGVANLTEGTKAVLAGE